MSPDSNAPLPNPMDDPPPIVSPAPSEWTSKDGSASQTAMQEPLADALSEPCFLHPSSIIFEAFSHIRKFVFPAVLGLVTAAQGSVWGAGFAAVVFAGSLMATLLRYFTLRYRIQNTDFLVTEGLIFRRVRSVPIRRIQNMDLVQNVLHRIFGVAEVNLETASGTKPEATLRVLTHSQIDQLRQAIFGAQTNESTPAEVEEALSPATSSPNTETSTSIAGSTESNVAVASNGMRSAITHPASPRQIYQISLKQLVLAGLASNRGTVFVGIVAGFYFQSQFGGFNPGDRDNFRFDTDSLTRFLPQADSPLAMIAFGLCALLVIVIVLRVLSVSWYILRFYDYQLTRAGDDLRISCGLLTRVSATVPRRRIQFISVHRPILMRWFGLASVRIETAGGAGDENESAVSTVSRRWFLPVVAEEDVVRVLQELRPDVVWNPEQLTWHGVSPLAPKRLMRLALIGCLLVSLVGLCATRPWGWIAGPVIFPVLAWLAIKKSRAKRYAMEEWGLAYQSGLLSRKLSYAFHDRIQTLQFGQTPFDRRWNMATLRIDTAAAGPAAHLIDVKYLDADFARQQFELLQCATARHRPTWA